MLQVHQKPQTLGKRREKMPTNICKFELGLTKILIFGSNWGLGGELLKKKVKQI